MEKLKTLKEMEVKLESLADIIDQKRSDAPYETMMSFADFKAIAKEEVDEYNALLREIKLLRVPTMQEIPDYGDLMTMKRFKGNVEGGGSLIMMVVENMQLLHK